MQRTTQSQPASAPRNSVADVYRGPAQNGEAAQQARPAHTGKQDIHQETGEDVAEVASNASEEEMREEPATKSLQRRMRTWEAKLARRERKMQHQGNAVRQQAEHVEEQERILSTLPFEVDDTKEDIRSITEESAVA